MDESSIITLAVIATSIWVLIDASSVMAGLSKEQKKAISSHGAQSPVGWFLVSLLLWIVGFPWYVVRRGQYRDAPRSPDAHRPQAIAFPVINVGRGRYRITGVGKDSKMDTTWHCVADNEANARVKAELEGIIVTGAEWVGKE